MNLKQLISTWLGDRWSQWFLLLSILLNAAGWAAILYAAPRDLDVSPLHYTIYFGINLTGRWTALFWLPAIGVAAIISHLFFSRLLQNDRWRRLWLILAAVINAMMIIDVVAILILLRTITF